MHGRSASGTFLDCGGGGGGLESSFLVAASGLALADVGDVEEDDDDGVGGGLEIPRLREREGYEMNETSF